MTVKDYVEARTREYRELLQAQLTSRDDLGWLWAARIARAAVDAVRGAEVKMSLLGFGDKPGEFKRDDMVCGLFENRCALCHNKFDTCAQVDICDFCRDAILKHEVRDDIWEIAHPAATSKE